MRLGKHSFATLTPSKKVHGQQQTLNSHFHTLLYIFIQFHYSHIIVLMKMKEDE